MKQKQRAKATEDEAPGALDPVEIEVTGSPVRCPYCHDACTAEDARAIVCQQCLSRHHAPCWREGAHRCSSCGSRKALSGRPPEVEVAPADLKLVRRGLAREAARNVLARHEGLEEADVLWALLEAASRELSERRHLPPWLIVVLAALLIPILAILVNA